MNNVLKTSLIILANFICAATYAATFSYDQIQLVVGQTITETSFSSQATDSKFARGSASLGIGDVLFLAADGLANNVNSGRSYAFGFGVHLPVNNQADVVAAINIVNASINSTGHTESDAGISSSASLRLRVVPKFELTGGIAYVSVFNNKTTGIIYGANLYLTDSASLVFQGNQSDKSQSYAAGLRINY